MFKVHPTAIVSPKARIADDVVIGSYCIVGDNVTLASGVELMSHVIVDGDTTIGEGTKIYPFATVGLAPQDLKYGGEKTKLVIGKNNVIREHATIHLGTEQGGGITVIGDNCLLMIGSHVAHDCRVGNNVVISNNGTLAGHVVVGDYVVIGGLSAVHQWVRIGDYAMVGGMSGVVADVMPFGTVMGNRAYLNGLNIIGMRRNGFSRDEINTLRNAYEMLFSTIEGTTLSDRVSKVASIFSSEANSVNLVLSFFRSASDRQFTLPQR